MYYCVMYSKQLIKGMLQPIVLQLLKEHKRMYGYEITQLVKERTQGRIEITEGALYPTLHKLEAEGILSTEKEYIGKRVRKYYTLTRSGKSVVTKRLDETKAFLASLQLLLGKKTTA